MTDTIEEILDRWTRPDSVRLHAGEIGFDEMLTVLAITRAMARQIREALIDEGRS